MNIIICDDDSIFCDTLHSYVDEFISKNNISDARIHTFNSGEQALDFGEKTDIAFLDVEMSGLSGIHTGRELKKRNKNVLIFIITAYDDYIDEAFKFQAFRYISKPLNKNRLFRNIQDALYLYNSQNKKIAIETKEMTQTALTSDIIMLETHKRNVVVYTTFGTFASIHNMNYWTECLKDYPFFQTHRSFLINLDHVINFTHDYVKLTGGLTAYLTVRKHTSFKNTYLRYLDAT